MVGIGMARLCLQARGDRAKVLELGTVGTVVPAHTVRPCRKSTVCTVCVVGSLLRGFCYGLCLGLLWGALRSKRGILMGKTSVGKGFIGLGKCLIKFVLRRSS